jgi:hypothetical protein
MVSKCECGNTIDVQSVGEGVEQCEWCISPEPPMYKVNNFGGSVVLVPLGLGETYNTYQFDGVVVYGWNQEIASLIFDDYLSKSA